MSRARGEDDPRPEVKKLQGKRVNEKQRWFRKIRGEEQRGGSRMAKVKEQHVQCCKEVGGEGSVRSELKVQPW
jgi:hypothetical protein